MRRKLIRPWLVTEDEKVLAYIRAGLPLKSVAIKLRRTRRAVQARIIDLKRKADQASTVFEDRP